MEDKLGGRASIVLTLILFTVSVSVMWHNGSKVAKLQSELDQVKLQVKRGSIPELLALLAVQSDSHGNNKPGRESTAHQRQLRQDDPLLLLRAALQGIVESQLQAHLNCSTDDQTKCTIEPGPKGDPGPPGLPGEMGHQGLRGHRGVKGNVGYPGYKGEVGEKGELGEQGAAGPKGERGVKGDMGPRGPTGEKGEQGNTGAEGAKGDKGQLGDPGYTGERGLPGQRGPSGEKGQKGEVGVQGPVGPKGLRGDPGSAGPEGVKGQKGQVGYPGYKGQKGEEGDVGPQGLPGEKGEDGPIGPKGERGSLPVVPPCCSGDAVGWTQVAYLDMSNTSYSCPGSLVLYETPKRSCGRGSSHRGCISTLFSVNGQFYSKVCGRITGYQVGGTTPFFRSTNDIDSRYINGVSLTYGSSPRQHIWSFASALGHMYGSEWNCPCTANTTTPDVPSFINDNYFCETGTDTYTRGTFYSNKPLWDGEGCKDSSTCCEFNNPPWFCRELTESTTEDIEMRLCSSYHATELEDTPLELIELYIK